MGRKAAETTLEVRSIVIKLFNQGKTYAQIAEAINRSRTTVFNIVQRYKKFHTVLNKPRTGRPPKLSVREQRKIVRHVQANPLVTASEITAQLKEDLGKHVHVRTVRRVLNRTGYNSRTPRRKPFVSTANQKKRLQFANEFITKGTEFWDNVLWSDESKFNIYRTDGRTRVWRKANTEWNPKNMIGTVKHGAGGVMVWGCMASNGVGNLVFIDGNMDRFQYKSILQNNLKISAEKLGLGNSYYFQQDNDPKHTSEIVRLWLVYNTPHTLKTPPQSPDCNPIEHIWNELDDRLRKHHIRSKAHLKELLLQEWNNITSDVTKKYVHLMPKVLAAIIARKGHITKY